MLTGVARYIQEHEPWAVYLKPFGVEKSLPNWLRDWHGDGIIAAVKDPASDVVVQRGIPVVDVVGVLRHEHVPLVHTNDQSVGRLGAEHLLEQRFINFGFCEYAGEFWSPRRKGIRGAPARAESNPAPISCPCPALAPAGRGPSSNSKRELSAWLGAEQADRDHGHE